MLGHKMWQTLSSEFPDAHATMRGHKSDVRWRNVDFLQSDNVHDGIDASQFDALLGFIRELKPSVVVNCVGAIKQRPAADDPIISISLNSLLPHLLRAEVGNWNGRVIHFSTDCVFSGKKGDYTEADPSDAEDLYGKTKYLGEVGAAGAVTLRTSIIGRELEHHASLLDWFLLGQHQAVRGFTRALWSGVTTNHLSKLVAEIIRDFGYLSGLYQVSSGTISKYDLLCKVRDAYRLPVEITADDSFFCDRSLRGDKFEHATGYSSPTLDAMLDQLVHDPTPYDRWIN
jgi:dTDP-4-dehydrorhamnose reductase